MCRRVRLGAFFPCPLTNELKSENGSNRIRCGQIRAIEVESAVTEQPEKRCVGA
jgi:hypothetical protein